MAYNANHGISPQYGSPPPPDRAPRRGLAGGWCAASRAWGMVKCLSINRSFSPTARRPLERGRQILPSSLVKSRRRETKTQIYGQAFSNSLRSDPSESDLGCLLWASPRVGAGPADCLGGGAATWAPPSTRRSSQESDVTSVDVAGRVTGGCRRRTTRKVLVDAQARACAVAGAGLGATPMSSGCCPGFETKIGGFARPTCRKFEVWR